VIDPLAAKVSAQVVDALDVEARVASRLPEAMQPLAASITLAVRDAITTRLQTALANPRLQGAIVRTVSIAHQQVMNLLRDRADAVQVVNGYVVVQVWPVVGAALAELQSMGLIPADVQLPDLSSPETSAGLASRLESAFGVTLPPDFGTIQLMPADRLLTARTVVRAFDVIVVLLIVLSVALVALALWLSSHRRHMLIYLALGVIIAFLLARLAINAITGAIIGGIADEGLSGAVRTVVDATIANLRQVTAVILVVTALLAVAAYLWGRPRWLTSAGSAMRGAAGQAGSAAAAAGGSGIGAVAGAAPSRAGVETTVRENRPTVERVGLSVIIFVVVWIALGLEIALIGALLVVAFELVLRALAPSQEALAPAVPTGPSVAAVPVAAEPEAPTVQPEPAPEAKPAPAPKRPRTRSTKRPPSS
jgi:hypothetical protein